jgi:hypothetical protein
MDSGLSVNLKNLIGANDFGSPGHQERRRLTQSPFDDDRTAPLYHPIAKVR